MLAVFMSTSFVFYLFFLFYNEKDLLVLLRAFRVYFFYVRSMHHLYN